jgi:hypothetical protein
MEMFPSALSIPTLSHYEKAGTVTNHADITQTMTGDFKMFKETLAIQDILSNLLTAQKRPQETRERMAK